MKINLKGMSAGKKAGFIAAVLALITLIVYCIYGVMYDYFDTVVFLSLTAGVVCFALYVLLDHVIAEVLNLAGVVVVAYGMGLFFLNSFPVWADRLNNITMYGSRGTLVPVVAIIVCCLVVEILGVVSCFGRKGA